MALRCVPLLALLALAAASCHGDVAGVVGNTSQVIGTLRDLGVAAQKRFANVSQVEKQLDEAGQGAKEDFDAKGYEEKTQQYSKLSQHASEKAKESLSTSNASVAEELSDEAEEALKNMTKVGFQLDAMEQALHGDLKSALDAKLRPELAAADKYSRNASSLQEKAHSMMDPLYSCGDAAEGQADSLNDQTNNALSAVDKKVRPYRHQISRHAREVQRSTERELFSDQDRTAVWRKTSRAVRGATWHALGLQLRQAGGVSSLQLGSVAGTAVLMAACAAAAALGALAAGLAASGRAARRSDYQLLAA